MQQDTILQVNFAKNAKLEALVLFIGEIMMKKFTLALMATLAFSTTAYAEMPCVVADPTGSPLNYRASPGGKILGSLKNGTEITVPDIAYYDKKGKAWVKIWRKGKYLGYAFSDYIYCYG